MSGRLLFRALLLAGLGCLSPVSVLADLITDGPKQPSDPPPGSYKLVRTGEELSKTLVAASPALKYIRIATRVLVAEGDVLAAAPFTKAYIDCDGNTLDFQRTAGFTVNEQTWLEFFGCTIYASGSEEAWAYRAVFHNARMIHPCQGSSSVVQGLAAGNRLQPIRFDQLPVKIPPDRQTLFLNGTFICLEKTASQPISEDTVEEANGVAPTTTVTSAASPQAEVGSNTVEHSDEDEASTAVESQPSSVPAVVVIGVVVSLALLLCIAAITIRTLWRKRGSGLEPWQVQLQEISVFSKEAKMSSCTSGSCEPSLVRTRNTSTSIDTFDPRSAGPTSNVVLSGHRLGSGLKAIQSVHLDIRPPSSKMRPHSDGYEAGTALPDIAIQHLEVLDLVGTGGYGNVYRGYWRGHEVAVKTILFQDTGASDQGKLDRACKEASIASNLCHPHIVCTLTHRLQQMQSSLKGELVDFKLYLVQEFCFGGTLSSLIRGRFLHTAAGGVNLNRVLTILLDVARGAGYMHETGLMHADLNPRNILLQLDKSICPQGDRIFDRRAPWLPMTDQAAAALDYAVPKSQAKLADFGLSVQPDEQASHVSNVRHGTPFYSAPEVRKDRQLRFASDVYSFGVIMWEMYTGSPPFVNKDGRLSRHPRLGQLPVSAPLNYAMLLRACLQNEPDSRPAFTQVLEILNDLKGEVAVGHYVAADESIQAVEPVTQTKQ